MLAPSLRKRIARAAFRAVAHMSHVQVLEEGRASIGERRAPWIYIKKPGSFYEGIASDALVGASDAWIEGHWEASDLGEVVAAFAATLQYRPIAASRALWDRVVPRVAHAGNDGRRGSTEADIAHHYDLPPAFFRSFLDESLTYSCARFSEDFGAFHSPAAIAGRDRDWARSTLLEAQRAKLEGALDATLTGPETELLEVGCGWGSLAQRAAARGASVLAVTLSPEQAKYVRESTRDHSGVSVLQADYRAIEGNFDAAISIEMIEAVGYERLDDYFGAVARVLKPGGRFFIQAIVMSDEDARRSIGRTTWIQRRVFPGGYLPSVDMLESSASQAGFRPVGPMASLGQHYAATLSFWIAALRQAPQSARATDVPASVRRTWEFYLEYSRGGFLSEYIDVVQMTFERS